MLHPELYTPLSLYSDSTPAIGGLLLFYKVVEWNINLRVGVEPKWSEGGVKSFG